MDSVPLGEIIAQSTTKNDRAIEQAMVALARELPFALGPWPSFTENVEDNFRVKVSLGAIDVQMIERGQARYGHQGLTFVDAFYEVTRLLAPQLSTEAKAAIESADADAKQLRPWLASASLVKHMFEVNVYYGRRAASLILWWMCDRLVKTGAYPTLQHAADAQATLVHALRLGGIPDNVARRIYREAMPQAEPTTGVHRHAMVVSQPAFEGSDDAALIASNVSFINALVAAEVTVDDVHADWSHCYYIDFFHTHLTSGGFAQFIHAVGHDARILDNVRSALRTTGASWHLQLLDRTLELVGTKALQRFQASDYPGGDNDVVSKIATILGRYDERFRLEEESKSVISYAADWLRLHPRLTVLSIDEITAEVERLSALIPDFCRPRT